MSEALGNRPTPEQLLILHAALDEPQAAARAWERWTASVGVGNADHASRRLFPLVYRRELHRLLDLPGREVDAARQAYRGSWIHNQRLFKWADEAIGVLEAAGIETLVIKGASLALLSYEDVGARPMDDVDVLVPHRRAAEAIRALEAAGWRAGDEDPLGYTQVHHSLGFAGPKGGNVDLHWFSLWQPADDEPLWRASIQIELAGAATHAPCAADQLLLVCVHGAPWSRFPSVRWVADAMAVLGTEGEALDWERLAREAERRRLTVVVSAALAYLRGEFGAPVPDELLARLDAAPARRHERAAFRAAGRPDGPVRTLTLAWDRYRRLRDLDTGAPQPASFPVFARRFWGLDSIWRLPLHGIRFRARRRERTAD